MNYSKNLQAAIDVLRKAKKVLVLTGAGISAESGIPTFRGGGGSSVWRGMPFDQLSSARLVQDDLPLLWDWFDYRRGIVGGCRPNQAHETLARASGIPRFRSFTVVTQNIDGLHQAAGTREVIELHGSIWRARCLSCGKVESLKVLPQDERPPVCRDCIDSMRPDVVLFGEPLPMTNLFVAQEHAGKCDVCIVIGTSAQVYPAAALPHKARANGAIVIEVNPEETELTPHTDISLQGKASEVLFDLFTFLEEPFEELEEIEELDVDIKLDEIRLDIEPEPVASEPETESPSLTFLLNEEFESNRELILEVGYEGAGAQIYLFKPDDGLPFFFVSGSGVTVDGSGGETPIEWEPELVGSVADGIKTIADGDKIFYADSVFVNPRYRSEIHSYLEETLKSLPEEEIRKLELFQRPSTADEWISPVKRDVAGLPDSTLDVSVPETSQTDQPAQISNPFAEPIAETETVEKVATEEVSDRHFILFWRETSVTAAERLGKPLNVVSSNHLDGILRGDTLWVATVEGGELVMIGRMRVGEVIERQEAEARFGDENVWKSNQFAVALDESACEIPRRIHLGETAFDLRFMEDESDRFISVEGRISRSQTRKMRELTFGSAELLSSLWEGDRDGDISDEDLEPKVINFDPAGESEPEPVEIDEDKLDRFAGCLLGGAIGDALGAPIEFQSIGAIRGTYGDAGITDYAPAYGKLGAITDDTQMTLFTAEGLLRAETRRSHRGICYPARIIYHAYLRWLQTQGATLEDESVKMHVYDAPSWLRDVPELNALRAPGNTCLEALGSGLMGTLEEPLNDRKGCGGVMRVAPIGLIALDPFRLASEAAAITHGHPSGYLSAGVLALIIGKVINGSSLMKAVEHAVYEILPQHDGHEETFKACDRAIRLAKLQLGLEVETGSDDVAPSSEGDEPRIGLPSPEAVESLGAGWIAEEALAISIYCSLVHEEDFEKAVLLAVNHSGDSDSTGAITGNILGALLGKERIPSRWLEELELRDVIAEISRDLLIGFRSDTQWSDRYPGI